MHLRIPINIESWSLLPTIKTLILHILFQKGLGLKEVCTPRRMEEDSLKFSLSNLINWENLMIHIDFSIKLWIWVCEEDSQILSIVMWSRKVYWLPNVFFTESFMPPNLL